MMRSTSKPGILPASFVAFRWDSLKYAGTVITACVIFSPSFASASAFIFDKIIAEISGGEKALRCPFTSTWTCASPFAAFTILYGTRCSSSCTSSYFRPMKRLIEKMVFCGFVTAWRFAAWPTSRSPFLVNATTEGVVRAPSLFSKTTGSPPSITDIQELVVPKSMPKTFAIWIQSSEIDLAMGVPNTTSNSQVAETQILDRNGEIVSGALLRQHVSQWQS